MDSYPFDRLAKAVYSAAGSRRGVVKGLAVGLIGGMLEQAKGPERTSAEGIATLTITGTPPDSIDLARAEEWGFAAYAPYWYVDDVTDSIIEVQNRRFAPLILLPRVTYISGERVDLDVLLVPPRSTVRLDLTPLVKSRSPNVQRTTAGEECWGDGSRPGSLLGSVQLVAIAPEDATAKSFCAWVVITSLTERRDIPIPFQNPTEALSSVMESTWWLPAHDVRAYFALHNGATVPVEAHVAVFAEGQALGYQTLQLPATSPHLISLSELLRPEPVPEVGGIRVWYEPKAGQERPGLIAGRGILAAERQGFTRSLRRQESFLNLLQHPTSPIEMHVAGVLFGASEPILSAERYMHPYLLLRNTAGYDVDVQGTVYGRNSNGESTALSLPTVTLRPQWPIVVDLEVERRAAVTDLADGVAGLRLQHDGRPTDVVADLINVGEDGVSGFSETVRNLFFHHPRVDSAVSFDLNDGYNTFIVVKNTTDTPRQALVVLLYDDGKELYETYLPETPAQQVDVVDIKRLRDDAIPDINGKILPRDLVFGGAEVWCLSGPPGAFVGCDPTTLFLLGPGPIGGEPGHTCMPADPEPAGCPDPPCITVAPTLRTITVWLNAFIPKEIEGVTRPVPGKSDQTMIDHPLIPGCYYTDNRTFSPLINARSRMHSEIKIDVSGPTPTKISEWHDTGFTVRVDCVYGFDVCIDKASTSGMQFSEPYGSTGLLGIVHVDVVGAASDPCIVASCDVDYKGTITINLGTRTVSWEGTSDAFPAFEIYATAYNGLGNAVALREPEGLFDLCGSPSHFSGEVTI